MVTADVTVFFVMIIYTFLWIQPRIWLITMVGILAVGLPELHGKR